MLVRSLLAVGLALVVAGCGTGGGATTAPATAASPAPTATALGPASTAPAPPATPAAPCPTPSVTVPSVFSVPGEFAELDQETFWVDPDFDTCTSLRALFTIPAPGWLAWTGTFKPDEADRHVGISIVTVTNLVVDGCHDHGLANPPVGPSVDDLATALAELEPFVVTSPPSDVTAYGYDGKYLEVRLPEATDLSTCTGGEVISWDTPVLSYPFHGYFLGLIEEFWILDVEGSRLAIITNRSPDSPRADVAEMRAILDSIEIEP